MCKIISCRLSTIRCNQILTIKYYIFSLCHIYLFARFMFRFYLEKSTKK
uniref:Uncharacterized protein n=1 Tax=Caudovirales sp. ctCiv1 TaxID=2826769 RepID=A0A8S5M8D8_9CAUD|nr:MAG TPA: hypothetical protein [Caudovirales sp. ctCiv1]